MDRGTDKSTYYSPAERAGVRVGRFIRSARPNLSDLDRALAEEWLPEDQLLLFLSQSEADQRHAVMAARLLLGAGYASSDLIAAALLHDVGKRGAHFTPWHRTIIAVLEAAWPGLLHWLSRWQAHRSFRPFALHEVHCQEGATLAAEAGASLRTVELIKAHHQHSPGTDVELQMLQWADERA